MSRFLLFAAALLGSAASAPAQTDGVTITLRKDAVGDRLEVTQTGNEAVTASVAGTDVGHRKRTKFVYVQEILAYPADARGPTKLTRIYEVAERTKEGETTKLPYEAKTVTIEKKGKKFAFTVDGKELPAADAEELEKEFNGGGEKAPRNEDFLPKGPVKPNEAWSVPPGPILDGFEEAGPSIVFDRHKCKVTGKLTKVYAKGGVRFGVIEIELALPVKAIGSGDRETEVQAGGKFGMRIDLDVCIDGSTSDGTVRTAMKVNLKADLAVGAMDLDGAAGTKTAAKQIGKK